jgi:[ribosomal protein S5]-alanine N-acetyltransferase
MKYLLNNEYTRRLHFRKLETGDWDTWLTFFKDPLLGKYWKAADSDPVTLCDRWFEKNFYRYDHGLGGMNALIDRVTQTFIGQCGLLIQTVDGVEELEVAYSIMPEHRNKGYASEAALKCITYAFKKQWHESIISIIHVENVESERVAIKNNLKLSTRTIYDNNPVNIYRIHAP